MIMRKFCLAAAVAMMAIGTANAAPATGDAIKAAIGGNSVQGNMDSSGPYAEFYQADGVIKGKDYAGKWTIEGDTMCFEYDGTPKDCWSVEISGDQVKWLKDGKSGGSGTIVPGNPNNF
ncbi:hypothetical protein [Dongia rigui]|uniref:Uncharacterized protein n=1 Tax=Dongia rigui TaxID=940149 RepID=A0ABU5DX05_9PROT|nr:hypothetical protein [Dongia rigui]MDY0871809.1 hypothetical protein [Dongia rigui]